METPIKMDDLGVPLFLETPKYMCKFYFLCFNLIDPKMDDLNTKKSLNLWSLFGSLRLNHSHTCMYSIYIYIFHV